MTPSTPLPEQGGFNERLDSILFAQYQLGRWHQRLSHGGNKRAVGGEITEAKAAIRTLVLEELESRAIDAQYYIPNSPNDTYTSGEVVQLSVIKKLLGYE